MKTRLRETYNCDFCNKLYVRKGACEKHEQMCIKNPKNNRPCFHCRHLEKRKADTYHDTYAGEVLVVVDVFHCSKLQKYLYTPKTEAKNNWIEIDYEDKTNNPMPLKCDLFESTYFDESLCPF